MQNRPGPPGPRPASYIESADYLRAGYLDARGNTRPDLLTVEATRVANELSNGRLNSAQLRHFFNKLKGIELRLNSGMNFEDARPLIVSLMPAAAYAVNRGVAPREFRSFIDKNVQLAQQSEKAFRNGLLQHFQSIVCYFPRQQGQ